jgi:hypothetical protein
MRIEGVLERMEKRLNHIEGDLKAGIRELRRNLNHRFYWILGVQIFM